MLAVCTTFVYTANVLKNVTLSAEDNDIELAREEARSQNTTLNALFRDWLKGTFRGKLRIVDPEAPGPFRDLVVE